jgi:hypothetical protein
MDLQKIMMSKAIMDRHNQMDKGTAPKAKSNPVMENFDLPNVKYNIPQDMLGESPRAPQFAQQPVAPSSQFLNKPYPAASSDAIKNSRLPDAIKKLMIEHPIEQPTSMGGSVTLSDELVERASRLMGQNKKPVVEQSAVQYDSDNLRNVLKEVVKEVLSENGLIVENVEKSNDNFRFQVGKHIFEGKLTKVKKLS